MRKSEIEIRGEWGYMQMQIQSQMILVGEGLPPGQSLRARKAGLRGLWHTPSAEVHG